MPTQLTEDRLVEVQVDRIVGPTHHFGGLGVGNIASSENAGRVSNPQAAALQGLDKMRLVAELGVPQFVLPPQSRPDLNLIRELGFAGNEQQILDQASSFDPVALSAAFSSSAMWTANAATVSPSTDSASGKLQLTVANLSASLHRSIEQEETLAELSALTHGIADVYPGVCAGDASRDEGAANHMRLCDPINTNVGVNVFVYGDGHDGPLRNYPRQALRACQTVARRHGLSPRDTFFIQQSQHAIEAGAFHNDVVAASHHDVVLFHEDAFTAGPAAFEPVAARFKELTKRELRLEVVRRSQLSIDDAIHTYLFNSQIVSPLEPRDAENHSPAAVLLCPAQVRGNLVTRGIVRRWVDTEKIFSQSAFIDLGQSMRGGGGPACLRLRLPVRANGAQSLAPSMRWTEQLDGILRDVINEQYPDSVSADDFVDTDFVRSARDATQAIRKILLPDHSD